MSGFSQVGVGFAQKVGVPKRHWTSAHPGCQSISKTIRSLDLLSRFGSKDGETLLGCNGCPLWSSGQWIDFVRLDCWVPARCSATHVVVVKHRWERCWLHWRLVALEIMKESQSVVIATCCVRLLPIIIKSPLSTMLDALYRFIKRYQPSIAQLSLRVDVAPGPRSFYSTPGTRTKTFAVRRGAPCSSHVLMIPRDRKSVV